MQTMILVQNANCSYCMNAVKDDLLARPQVREVQMNATAGCLVVDHDHDDPAALIALLHQSLHGWQVASNGEIIEVTTDSVISDQCAWH